MTRANKDAKVNGPPEDSRGENTGRREHLSGEGSQSVLPHLEKVLAHSAARKAAARPEPSITRMPAEEAEPKKSPAGS